MAPRRVLVCPFVPEPGTLVLLAAAAACGLGPWLPRKRRGAG